jgi:uncharacterized membrane protein
MDGLALARALHVVAVVVWIGGLSIVTTALLPAIRRGELGGNWLAAFQAIERRFVWQARIAILLVGGTGLYMIEEADLWDRFSSLAYWWMHAMVGLWAIFAIGLFLVEPLILDRRLHDDHQATGRYLRLAGWSALALAHAEPGYRLRLGRREPWMADLLTSISWLRRQVIADRVSVGFPHGRESR